jgi:hypothetical protein
MKDSCNSPTAMTELRDWVCRHFHVAPKAPVYRIRVDAEVGGMINVAVGIRAPSK